MWPFKSKKAKEGEVNQNCLLVRIRPGYYKSEKELTKALLEAFPFLVKSDVKEIMGVLDRCGDGEDFTHFRMMIPGNYTPKQYPDNGILCSVAYGDLRGNCDCYSWVKGSCCGGPNFNTTLDASLSMEGAGKDALPPTYRCGRHVHHMWDKMDVDEHDDNHLRELAAERRDW